MKNFKTKILRKTPFLNLVEVSYQENGIAKKWYGVNRTTANAAVVIAALTYRQELILVRQPRPIIGGCTIEFPAGLRDVDGEDPLETAERELLEETGYKAFGFEIILGGKEGLVSSPGLTNERLILVGARDAICDREPLSNENTEPILIHFSDIDSWLQEQAKSGEIDYKVFGTVELVKRWNKKEVRD